MEKKKITLSIPVDTNDKLGKLAQQYGMTKSGLVNFLVNKLDLKDNLYE